MSLTSGADITKESAGKDQDLTENANVPSSVAELVNVKSSAGRAEGENAGANALVPRCGYSPVVLYANRRANGKVHFFRNF